MSKWSILTPWQPQRSNTISVKALLVGLAVVVPIAAFAAPEISGTPDAVSIDAQHSSVKEILTQLHRRFDVQFQSTANLDTPLTGTYQGPLRQIVARLLAGYNFIMITKQGGLDVTVFGGPSTSTAATASNATTIGPNTTATVPAQSPQGTAAVPSNQEVLPAVVDQSSGPIPLIRVAEDPSAIPSPTLTPSSAAGPVPGPATSSMPTPTSSGNMPMPTPTPSGNVPMPTPSSSTSPMGGTAASGSPGTSPPSIAPTPANPATPAPQKP